MHNCDIRSNMAERQKGKDVRPLSDDYKIWRKQHILIFYAKSNLKIPDLRKAMPLGNWKSQACRNSLFGLIINDIVWLFTSQKV